MTGILTSVVIADFARECSEKTDMEGLRRVGEVYRHWMTDDAVKAICRPIYETRQNEIKRGIK